MEKTKEKVIAGITFTVAPFPAIEALRLKSYLVKTLGPALAEAIDIFKGAGNAEAEISGESLCGVVEKLTASLDEENFVKLVQRMFRFVTAKGTDSDGKPIVAAFGDNFDANFNKVFGGRLFSIYPVMLLVLEANYQSRLDEIGSVGKLAPEIEEEFLLWRIWQKKGVPLDELRNKWTYEDLLHANAVLDMDEDIEAAVDGLIDFETKQGAKQ